MNESESKQSEANQVKEGQQVVKEAFNDKRDQSVENLQQIIQSKLDNENETGIQQTVDFGNQDHDSYKGQAIKKGSPTCQKQVMHAMMDCDIEMAMIESCNNSPSIQEKAQFKSNHQPNTTHLQYIQIDRLNQNKNSHQVKFKPNEDKSDYLNIQSMQARDYLKSREYFRAKDQRVNLDLATAQFTMIERFVDVS